MKRFSKPTVVNEQGFASLIVGLILVLVLSLLTVGFATLVRNEQGQTLNKQLSTQAFYAAESGVNDAERGILGPSPTITTSDTNNCKELLVNGGQIGSAAQASDQVANTCLLVNLTPPDLSYGDVENQSSVTQFTSAGASALPTAVSDITISWECRAAPGTCTFPTGGFNPKAAFPSTSGWTGSTGVLEISVTPLSAVDRNSLINNTFTTLLYPQDASAAADATASGASGSITSVNCNYSKRAAVPTANGLLGKFACTATIPVSGATSYLVRMRSIYQPSTVDITMNDGAGDPLNFSNGQALIDSTGKAQGVLKRIQVSIPLTPANGQWPNALEGGSICKTLDISPDAGVTGPDSVIASDSSDSGSCAFTTSASSPGPNSDPGTGDNCSTPPCGGGTPTSYNWSRTLFNNSNNTSPVTGCVWTFTSSGGINASPPTESGSGTADICKQYGNTGLNTGAGTILVKYSPAPNTPSPFDPSFCYSIPETATLTMTIQGGHSKNVPLSFGMPQCS